MKHEIKYEIKLIWYKWILHWFFQKLNILPELKPKLKQTIRWHPLLNLFIPYNTIPGAKSYSKLFAKILNAFIIDSEEIFTPLGKKHFLSTFLVMPQNMNTCKTCIKDIFLYTAKNSEIKKSVNQFRTHVSLGVFRGIKYEH